VTSLVTIGVYGGAGYGAYTLVDLSQERGANTFQSFVMLPLFVQELKQLSCKSYENHFFVFFSANVVHNI
jgi:hypothetical protein